ncbi:hypothetical protein C8R45DRAFT_426636 [Mycena sanguinolenta]|nr:hypothetical protein C8R45DRAFT_426636 [Mycena sanguinolenta]
MNSRQQTSVSTSPRRTFSDRISAVGARVARALSSDMGRDASGVNAETESMTSTVVEGNDRSTSRGRNNFHSSGRGGAGNIHRDPVPAPSNSNAEDFPWPRGRERAPVSRLPPAQNTSPSPPAKTIVHSTGRGGSGNFSLSPPAKDPSYSLRDREILRARAEADRGAFRSSGRGGIGNISAPSHPDSTPAAAYASAHANSGYPNNGNGYGNGNGNPQRSRSIDPVSPTNMPISPSQERERRGREKEGWEASVN